jgi:hypothetical protein
MGGRRVTVGSDTHRTNQFGVGLIQGYASAAAAGFESLAFGRAGRLVDLPERFAAARAIR